MTAVALDQLGMEFAGTPVLSDITVQFPHESITAVIGRSGSGKSTLLRSINGLVRPTSGRVEVMGNPIDYQELPALRRGIGYAVQGTGLFPHLSVESNITLPARLAKWDSARLSSRLEHLLKLVHLDRELLPRYPHELSGGQQQRAGLARAMILEPPLLLLDEPFAALDPLTRLDVHRQLLELQRAEPRCILLVTHDMREAMQLADRIIVLEQGRLLEMATVDELKARHPDLEPEEVLLKLLGEST
ncbi:MAG: ATP-binding cassette domain-containing protein [Halieaceae bacterium]|nr:ATP-binding cassette domain-containing protein [Halieaceae bacterium]